MTAVVRLLVLTGLFGSAIDDWERVFETARVAVSEVVSDASRRTRALALVDAGRDAYRERLATRAEHLRRFWSVDSRYDATLEDYRREVRAFQEAQVEWREEYLARRERLTATLTKGEWDEIFARLEESIDELLETRRLSGQAAGES